MIDNKKLSLYQAVLLIVASRISNLHIYLPALNAPPYNQDIWIVELLSALYIFIISMPILYLVNKFEVINFMEIIEILCGKFVGKFIVFIYALFLLFVCVLLNGHLMQFVGSAIMPETPVYIIILFSGIATIYVSFKGIETMGRTAEILVPLILIIIIMFTLLSLNKMDFKFIFPILADSKLSDINIGSLNIALRFYDIILIAALSSNFQKKSHINKCLYISVSIITVFFVIMTISTQAVLGVEQAKHARFPYFIYTRQINLFDFIQRVESINVISCFFTVFIKLSIYSYASALCMQQIFNTKSYKIFIIPEVIVTYLGIRYTPLYKSVIFSKVLSYKIFPFMSAVVIIVIPVFLLIIYFFRRRNLTSKA